MLSWHLPHTAAPPLLPAGAHRARLARASTSKNGQDQADHTANCIPRSRGDPTNSPRAHKQQLSQPTSQLTSILEQVHAAHIRSIRSSHSEARAIQIQTQPVSPKCEGLRIHRSRDHVKLRPGGTYATISSMARQRAPNSACRPHTRTAQNENPSHSSARPPTDAPHSAQDTITLRTH